MANSSILGGERAASIPRGTDVDALGPSDSSDSGSDVQTDLNRSAMPDEASEGAFPIAHGGSSDAAGTGERASADPAAPSIDSDLMPDRIGVFPRDAMEVATSIDDPEVQGIDELAVQEDEDSDDVDSLEEDEFTPRQGV